MRPRAAVQIDPAVLGGYVGRYIVDPARTLTVSAEHDRLFIEITDQQRLEVYPQSEGDFFWTAVAAQITFVADDVGRATRAIIHQNGRDLLIARVEPVAVGDARDTY